MTDTTSTFTMTLVTAVEDAWRAIQRVHSDVPDVILTVGAGSVGDRRSMRLGHFAADQWQHDDTPAHELFLGGEGLNRGGIDVFGTLLHEAAHGVATVRGTRDTSRNGRYHNAQFRALAAEVGLTVERNTQGWSVTSVPNTTAEQHADTIAALELALVAFRRTRTGDGTTKTSNGVVASCGCPRQFRITRSVLDAGPIICGVCGQPFTAPDAETG